MTYTEVMFTALALRFEDAATMLGITEASLQRCRDNGWLRPGFSKKDLTLYDAVDIQQLWRRLKEDPDMAKSVKLKTPLHFSAVGVEPLAVSRQVAAKMLGMSSRRFTSLIQAGWIQPAFEQGTLVLFDTGELRHLWERMKRKGLPG